MMISTTHRSRRRSDGQQFLQHRRVALAQLVALGFAPNTQAFAASTNEVIDIPLLLTPVNRGVYNAYAVMQSRAEQCHAPGAPGGVRDRRL